MSLRLKLPSRRNHITQKVRIGGRTLYVSVHDDQAPTEIFLRVKGNDCTPETIAIYDVIARLTSIALQCGAPSKRSAISSQAPNLPHTGPSLDTDG